MLVCVCAALTLFTLIVNTAGSDNVPSTPYLIAQFEKRVYFYNYLSNISVELNSSDWDRYSRARTTVGKKLVKYFARDKSEIANAMYTGEYDDFITRIARINITHYGVSITIPILDADGTVSKSESVTHTVYDTEPYNVFINERGTLSTADRVTCFVAGAHEWCKRVNTVVDTPPFKRSLLNLIIKSPIGLTPCDRSPDRKPSATSSAATETPTTTTTAIPSHENLCDKLCENPCETLWNTKLLNEKIQSRNSRANNATEFPWIAPTTSIEKNPATAKPTTVTNHSYLIWTVTEVVRLFVFLPLAYNYAVV